MTAESFLGEIPTGPYAHMTWAEKFWLFVRKGPGCWEWRGKRYPNGYGAFGRGARSFLAHRVAYALVRGETPEHLMVCHSCDNRKCVNPDHLFLGTQSDNVADMIAKGRAVALSGEKSPRAILTENEVREMRRLGGAGVPQKMLAEMFGVSPKQVSVIINRKQWRHVA